MPVNYPPGYRGRATGTLSLAGEPGHYRLSGNVSLSQGYYTAEFDAKSQSLDRRVAYAWILGRKPGEPAGRFVFGPGHAF